ncbi:hypothetical protein QBC32DRAFT_344965 [Pseudoneurospora amorphoporcata]|uniref:COP9 signalosome complex subunit 4 n=1 Tax=Pseudoneurospora amorphoporcata TaxID=241081 RepID=A0AAN6SEU8_9PEZI|nr:hypothetical protein QBC32DRAFT_344965 [Pseudoneurospora amorphoporcata]
MASPELVEDLALVLGLSQPERPAAYKSIMATFSSNPDAAQCTEDLIAITDTIFSESLGVVATRALVIDLIDSLKSLASGSGGVPSETTSRVWLDVGKVIAEHITSNPSLSTSLVDQTATIYEDLIAAAYESQDSFTEAAKTLAAIPLDSSQRRVSDQYKADLWIRIIRNYLEDDDATSAETYLNKLKNIIHNVAVDNPELNLHFKLSAARIQDSNRQFLAASQSYYDISLSPAIAEEERLHTLSMAIKCAVLAPAGPPRSRVLGRLYKDERSASLEQYGILEKMFLDRLLTKTEVDKFAQDLAPHQLATTSDGSTVLAKAMVEHNLLAVSRLYRNIGFDALGSWLGLDSGNKAEEITARMIEQGRLAGSIDQIDRVIYFESGQEASGEKGSGRVEVPVGKEMRRQDGMVQALAEDLERITDDLLAEFPQLVPAGVPGN